MREILFRGYTYELGDGRWVYGDYSPETGKYMACIFPQKPTDLYDEYAAIGVVPESVGQFTGLKDGHGQPIYEGDILRDEPSGLEYQMLWFDEYGGFGLANRYGNMDVEYVDMYVNDTVVIGTVYENPEWLEGKKIESCVFDEGNRCIALKRRECDGCSFRKTHREYMDGEKRRKGRLNNETY